MPTHWGSPAPLVVSETEDSGVANALVKDVSPLCCEVAPVSECWPSSIAMQEDYGGKQEAQRALY
jgi:hypothetical protein